MNAYPNPRLAPAPADLISRLQVARESLHAVVLAQYFERHPPDSDARRAYVEQRCREDLGSHLDQPAAALQPGDPDVFNAYLRWLYDVMASRCLAVGHTADALRTVHDWVGCNVNHPRTGDVLTLLEQGIATLEQATRGTALVVPEPTAPVRAMSGALLAGQRGDAESQVLGAMAGGARLVDVSVDLLQPALYQVGLLWQQNRISVAQEHLATAITQTAMAAGFVAAELAPPNDRSAAFACIEGNLHAVGLRMVSDAFEVAGWDVSFLGASVPSEALLAFCGEQRPEVLGLSVSLAPQLPVLRELIGRLRAELGNAAPQVLVGGQLVNRLGAAVRGIGADAWFSDARAVVEEAGK